MNPFTLFALAALATGALIPIQAATNTQLNQHIGNVAYSSFLLFAVGLVGLAGVLLVKASPLPSLADVRAAPWYSYSGGLIVATYVFSITFLAPRMGLANAICFVVSGQILAAVCIDHFGWINTPISSITPQRLLGVGLMIGGLFLARH